MGEKNLYVQRAYCIAVHIYILIKLSLNLLVVLCLFEQSTYVTFAKATLIINSHSLSLPLSSVLSQNKSLVYNARAMFFVIVVLAVVEYKLIVFRGVGAVV